MSRYINIDELKEKIAQQKLLAKEPAAKRIVEIINGLPTADVQEVRYGEWIPDDYEYYHCSECGFENDEREYITPYCPHCGAKMDLEESE